MISLSAGKISKIIGLMKLFKCQESVTLFSITMLRYCRRFLYRDIATIIWQIYARRRFKRASENINRQDSEWYQCSDDHGKEMANMKFDMTRAR